MSKAKAAKFVMNYLRKLFDDLPDQVKKDLPEQPKGGGLRVFHGSDKEYQTMDISHSRKQDQFFGEGFYFTIDPKIAKEYANIRAIKDLEKLSPEQRARLPELLEKKVVTPKEIKTGAIHNFKGEMVKVENILKNQNVEGKPLGNLGQNIKEFNLDVTNPYVVKSNKQRMYLKNNIDKIKARGYDSVIYDNFSDRSKQIMVFPEYIDKIKKVGAFETLFNKGGTTMKNNPPVGSLPEEVADDIPAMISEGEFVIPADVVRYVGLDKIHCMMREAKMGLKAMEHEGLIVDVDEEGRPEEPQEEPKGEVAIIDVVQIEKAEPMVKELKEGGVVSPILNPEEEVNVMNKGGMIAQETGPDGTMRILGMQEGGMADQMDAMMGAEMPQEEPVTEFAEEMPPAQTEPMPEAPMMNAPVAQVINGVPHLMAYLQEDEIKALQDAGRGLDENGEQMLSPEGIPVFVGGDGTGADDTGAEPDDDGHPGDDVGGMDTPEIEKMQSEMTKADKEALDPEADDKKFVKNVGFIEEYIASRNKPNPLQGMPQYAVAKAAQGGLMRSPVYLENGGMMDDEDNRRFEGMDEGGSIPFNPQDLPADEQNRLEAESRMPVQEEAPIVSEEAPSEPNIASQEEVRERLPDLFNQETGERFGNLYGPQGGYRAEQILGEDPDISDASLDYLRQNRDVFLNAKDRVESDEGVSYEDVAKQHFNLFGKNEDRRGAEGLMSMQQDQPEESVGDAVGDIAGGIMSPDTPAPTTEQQGFFTEDEKDKFVEQLGNIDMTGFEDVQKKMVADTFIEREDGSFDLDPRSIVGSHLQNFRTADNKRTTPDQATYREGPEKGQPLSRQLKMNIMEAQIDNLSNQYVR